MDLNWIQSILVGLISGIADILPVSAPAHRTILLKLMGEGEESPVLRLLIHVGTLAALYYCNRNHILRFSRAIRLSRIPKRRRKRPLDNQTLMDIRVLKTALIPIVIGFIFYLSASKLSGNLLIMAAILLINGIIIFIPQYLPGSNKKADSMTPVDSLLVGLGSGVSVLPGVSAVGCATSVGLIRGLDSQYSVNTALLLNLPVTLGLIIFDFVAIVGTGMGSLTFGLFLCYILAGIAAFAGTYAAFKTVKALSANVGFSGFAYYCWGLALLSLFLYLTI